jgi:phosphatidylinositol alpha-1,6-mannosyltransferase
MVGTVHGLDMIAPLQSFQRAVNRALSRLDRVVCVSRATAAEVVARGVPPERIQVIHNAAESIAGRVCPKEEARQKLQTIIDADLAGKKVLLSVGRPVKRKGFDSFVSMVFRHLPDDYVYMVAGPEVKTPGWLRYGSTLLSAHTRRNLLVAAGFHSSHDRLVRQSAHPRMFYLNGASDEVRDLLYAACDLFVLPNRHIPGDMEGFGIVALEAAARGIPVVAFGIEGITDAVIHGRNGICVKGRDYEGLRNAIESLLADPAELNRFGQQAAEFTRDKYSLQKVTGQYVDLFEELAFSK